MAEQPPRQARQDFTIWRSCYPTRAALADALRRLMKANYPLDGASDHGVSEALYLSDPDGNGVELYWDRPEQSWPRLSDRHHRDAHRSVRPQQLAQGT